MTIANTDGCFPSFNAGLIHDQQHQIIIYFLSLNGLIDFVSSLARDGIDALLRKIVFQTHILTQQGHGGDMLIRCVAMLLHKLIGVKKLRQKVLIRKDSAESPTTLIDAR